MTETVLIVSKTHMNNGQACVGGITLESGRYVRLIDSNGNNQPGDTDLEPKQAWEIDFSERENNVPPHIEDVIVHTRKPKGKLKDSVTIRQFLEIKKVPIWYGSPDKVFDKLIKFTKSGSGYIDKNGVPSHSVGFWVSDKDLKKKEYNGIRYQYPSSETWRSIKYKGYDNPIEIIPAGTLIRLSLARWKSFDEADEPKCWLQLSGWYDVGVVSSGDAILSI